MNRLMSADVDWLALPASWARRVRKAGSLIVPVMAGTGSSGQQTVPLT
jgi:hypothetical protein